MFYKESPEKQKSIQKCSKNTMLLAFSIPANDSVIDGGKGSK